MSKMNYVTDMDNGTIFRPSPEGSPGAEYMVYRDPDDGCWTWLWREPAAEETGPHYLKRPDAILSVADNWIETGGSYEPKFISTVRAYATRARKGESDD